MFSVAVLLRVPLLFLDLILKLDGVKKMAFWTTLAVPNRVELSYVKQTSVPQSVTVAALALLLTSENSAIAAKRGAQDLSVFITIPLRFCYRGVAPSYLINQQNSVTCVTYSMTGTHSAFAPVLNVWRSSHFLVLAWRAAVIKLLYFLLFNIKLSRFISMVLHSLSVAMQWLQKAVFEPLTSEDFAQFDEQMPFIGNSL